MRNLITQVIAIAALMGCGDASSTQQNQPAKVNADEVAPAGTPKLVIVRVKGKATTMDAVKMGEARVVDADKKELSAAEDSAEKLFADGQGVTIAESLESDADAEEASTESWRMGWGPGYSYLGFGWPSYSYYRPYAFYNPFYASAYAYYTPAYYYTPSYYYAPAYYTPYYYGGYSYYSYIW